MPDDIPQIAPRVAASTVEPPPPPLPPGLGTATARKLPGGWWNVGANHPAHKGLKNDILKSIDAAQDIDPDAKAFLISRIGKLDAKAIEVHCQVTMDDRGIHMNLHIHKIW